MTGIIIAVGFFLLGTVSGSFIDCVVSRLARKENFLWTRSSCPHCHHSLAWFDLIPLFSFLRLRGRCRYCQQKISGENPLVELGTGLLFLSIFLGIESPFWAGFLMLVCIPLGIVFLFDLKYSLIPSQFIYPALAFTFLFWGGKDFCQRSEISFSSSYLFSAFLGLVVMGGFLGGLYLLTRGKGMGLGDVELGALLGAILGWPLAVPALFFGFWIGAILGLSLIAFKKKGWKSEIPFGIFLILGSGIALAGGSQLEVWLEWILIL